MARIQVLTLPSQEESGLTNYPFAIVIDQVEHNDITAGSGEIVRSVATELFDKDAIVAATGATGVIVAQGTLEVC